MNNAQDDETGGVNPAGLMFSLTLAVVLVLGGAGLYWLYASMVDFSSPRAAMTSTDSDITALNPSAVSFNPPRPEDAPEDIREAVMLGYQILMETQTYAKDYVGNDLECRSCHFDAGRNLKTLSLVGVAAKYPKYRSRADYATDLVTRTQGCFERSMNGKPLPPEGKQMQAIMAYYHWISKGIPLYADVPWLGIKPLQSNHEANATAGEQVFQQVCARCHGQDGLGTAIAPPVWGQRSFNDGAGMNKPKNFSSFAYNYMPKDNPTLTVEQALDVAAYVTAQPRAHFESGK